MLQYCIRLAAVTQLSVAFPPEQRARTLDAFSGVTGLVVLASSALGGAIAGGLAWQWIFWLNIPIGLIVVPLVLHRIPESFGPRTALDIGGLLLVTAAALGVIWALVRGNNAVGAALKSSQLLPATAMA